MELTLTKPQKEYLNKKGVITPKELQRAYKDSVKQQKNTIKTAAKIRAKQASK